MFAVPAATAVTRPLLFTVATEVLVELQVTCAVIFWLVPSEYVQVAVSWLVVPPAGMLRLSGVTAMEDRVAVVTVMVVVSDLPP